MQRDQTGLNILLGHYTYYWLCQVCECGQLKQCPHFANTHNKILKDPSVLRKIMFGMCLKRLMVVCSKKHITRMCHDNVASTLNHTDENFMVI